MSSRTFPTSAYHHSVPTDAATTERLTKEFAWRKRSNDKWFAAQSVRQNLFG